MTDKNRPVQQINDGLLKAAIWKNTGEKSSFYTVTFERRYRDKNNKWHSTYSYGKDDLLALAKIAVDAHAAVKTLMDQDKAAAVQAETESQPLRDKDHDAKIAGTADQPKRVDPSKAAPARGGRGSR